MMGEAIQSETLKALVSQHALREVGLSIRLGGPTGQLQFLLGLILRLHLLVRLTASGRLLPFAKGRNGLKAFVRD